MTSSDELTTNLVAQTAQITLLHAGFQFVVIGSGSSLLEECVLSTTWGISDHVFVMARVTRRETEPQRERKSTLPITRPYCTSLFGSCQSKLVRAEKLRSLRLSLSSCCTITDQTMTNGAPCCWWDARLTRSLLPRCFSRNPLSNHGRVTAKYRSCSRFSWSNNHFKSPIDFTSTFATFMIMTRFAKGRSFVRSWLR